MKNYNGLRWTARITGSLILLLTMFMLVIIFTVGQKALEDIPVSSFTPRVIISVTLLCIAAGALMLAYRNEGLGGGISLLCNLAIAVFGIVNDKDPLTTLISFLIMSIPSLLYLSYWFAIKRDRHNPETANAT